MPPETGLVVLGQGLGGGGRAGGGTQGGNGVDQGFCVLRGLFLKDLKAQLNRAGTEEERRRITMAARFGLAALDHLDLG